MSAELVDVRFKCHPDAHAVLTAVALARGCDMSEILRDITQAWAAKTVHEATVIVRCTKREGFTGESSGNGGQPRQTGAAQ